MDKKWEDMSIDEKFEYIDSTYNNYETMTNKQFFIKGIAISGKMEKEMKNNLNDRMTDIEILAIQSILSTAKIDAVMNGMDSSAKLISDLKETLHKELERVRAINELNKEK
jgi:predicted methyltransferase MtxX (methanogen marker protein 4)